MHITLQHVCLKQSIFDPIIVAFRVRAQWHNIGGPAINLRVVGLQAIRELNKKCISNDSSHFALHPAVQATSLVCLDVDVQLIARLDFVAPYLL